MPFHDRASHHFPVHFHHSPCIAPSLLTCQYTPSNFTSFQNVSLHVIGFHYLFFHHMPFLFTVCHYISMTVSLHLHCHDHSLPFHHMSSQFITFRFLSLGSTACQSLLLHIFALSQSPLHFVTYVIACRHTSLHWFASRHISMSSIPFHHTTLPFIACHFFSLPLIACQYML